MERNWKQASQSSGAVINQKQSSSSRYVNRYSDVAYYGGDLVCESVGNKSDLQLIIAAPLLLDACKQFVNAADAPETDMQELRNAYTSAKQAIAVAEPVQLLLPGYANKEAEAFKKAKEVIATMLEALEMIDDLKTDMWSDKRHKLDVALAIGRDFEREVLGK